MPACLITESGNTTPKWLVLDPQRTYILGRQEGCDLVAMDPHVSREHAQISAINGSWQIRNLQAKNGTLHNGTLITTQTILSQGDRIQIGNTQLRFHEQLPEMALDSSSLVPSKPFESLLSPHGSGTGTAHKTEEQEISTLLQISDLSELLRFANTSLREENPHALVRRALEFLARQTAADMIAYVPIDPESSEQRLLWTRNNRVGLKVSRRLNQLTIESARPIWLEEVRKQSRVDSDSLHDVRDALCIPLFSRLPDRECLGTFHLYRLDSVFEMRQVHFAEFIGLSFSTAMRSLRDRLALQAENSRLREAPANAGRLVGSSAAIACLRERIAYLARASFPVLILGEPGVGKELVAEMIHQQSNRGSYSLVRVDCSSLSERSLEKALFGEPSDSQSGAALNSYLSQAEMGGLLLDEVTQLSPALQQQLVAFFEARQDSYSSGKQTNRADVRILATSSQDIAREVREGRFLEELYHRFVGVLTVPALREHASDIPELVHFFLELFQREYHSKIQLDPAALERLRTYSWPGNVRQLRSVLEVAVANVGPSGGIRAEDLALSDERLDPLEPPPCLNLAKLEEWAIKQALAQTQGNKTQAAKLLGIHRETLGLKMKLYQLTEG
jgi:two-component system response regulator HydG